MKSKTKYIFAILAALQMQHLVAAQDAERVKIGEKLSDCGALFGLLSQANTKQAEFSKNLSTASVAYAQVAFNDYNKFTQETGKSMQKASVFINELKETNNKQRFEEEFKTCMSTLEIAENTLRKEMSETSKAIVPELFK